MCACTCLGERQGSVIPAKGRVRRRPFRGNKENGRRCGCIHVCRSGRMKRCPQKGTCALMRIGGVLRGWPCTHGFNRPVEEMTLHTGVCTRVFCTAERLSMERCALVYIGGVQQEWYFAGVEERRYRRADPTLG